MSLAVPERSPNFAPSLRGISMGISMQLLEIAIFRRRPTHFPQRSNVSDMLISPRSRGILWYVKKKEDSIKKKHSRRHSSLTPFGVLSRSRFLHCIPATFTRAIIWMSRKFNAYYFSIFSQQIQQQKRNNLSIYDIYSENIVSNIHTT